MIWVLVVVAVVVVGLVGFVGTRPEVIDYERSGQVAAPPGVAFAIINDLRQWGRWSPYDARDRKMTKTFDGPPAGPGAGYAWDGNGKVGAGRMTIVESDPGRRVEMRLEFTRPFKCKNRVTFTIVPAGGDGCQVTWKMTGPNSLMGKVMSLFIDMDKMVGKDFEQGLVNLNTVARAEAARAGEGMAHGKR